MRIGGRQRPFYRVVAVDERAKRTGAYIENLGTYNPLTQPKEIKLNQDRIDHWVKQGAQMSVGFLRIIGKAPQRLPRKPKKEKKEEPKAVTPQPSDKTEEIIEEAPKEEVPAEKTPIVETPPNEETLKQTPETAPVEPENQIKSDTAEASESVDQKETQENSEPTDAPTNADTPSEDKKE